MNRARGAATYRVCATTTDRWEVFQDSSGEPVASFDEKHAALSYAMCLARGKAGWQLLLATRTHRSRDGFGLTNRPPRA